MKKYRVTVNGTTYEVDVEQVGEVAVQAAAAPQTTPVPAAMPIAPAQPAPKAEPAPAPVQPASAPAQSGGSSVTAPMPGTILKVNVQAGSALKKGNVMFILEAMKMENEIVAPEDLTIASVSVSQGASVSTGDILATYN